MWRSGAARGRRMHRLSTTTERLSPSLPRSSLPLLRSRAALAAARRRGRVRGQAAGASQRALLLLLVPPRGASVRPSGGCAAVATWRLRPLPRQLCGGGGSASPRRRRRRPCSRAPPRRAKRATGARASESSSEWRSDRATTTARDTRRGPVSPLPVRPRPRSRAAAPVAAPPAAPPLISPAAAAACLFLHLPLLLRSHRQVLNLLIFMPPEYSEWLLISGALVPTVEVWGAVHSFHASSRIKHERTRRRSFFAASKMKKRKIIVLLHPSPRSLVGASDSRRRCCLRRR